MNKKGMELPINIIVVLAVAVIVLLIIVSLFISGTGGQTDVIKYQSAFQKGCNQLSMAYGCEESGVSQIQVNVDGEEMDFTNVAAKVHGTTTSSTIAALCGCPVDDEVDDDD